MKSRRHSVQLIFASVLVPTLLAGCVATKEQVVVVEPELPEQRLVIHELGTEIGNKKSVAASVDFTNHTGRAVEYVMFKTTAFDHQGKLIPSMKSGRPNAWLRIAGPLQHGNRTGSNRWEKVWANTDINCFRVEGAEVIYEDSSVEFYQLDQIQLDLAMLPSPICQLTEESLAAND